MPERLTDDEIADVLTEIRHDDYAETLWAAADAVWLEDRRKQSRPLAGISFGTIEWLVAAFWPPYVAMLEDREERQIQHELLLRVLRRLPQAIRGEFQT